MPDVMLPVPTEVRDRLALIARARGTSISALLRDLAESAVLPEAEPDRAERDRSYLAEQFGVWVTDEESAAMGSRVRAAFSRACRHRPR